MTRDTCKSRLNWPKKSMLLFIVAKNINHTENMWLAKKETNKEKRYMHDTVIIWH